MPTKFLLFIFNKISISKPLAIMVSIPNLATILAALIFVSIPPVPNSEWDLEATRESMSSSTSIDRISSACEEESWVFSEQAFLVS